MVNYVRGTHTLQIEDEQHSLHHSREDNHICGWCPSPRPLNHRVLLDGGLLRDRLLRLFASRLFCSAIWLRWLQFSKIAALDYIFVIRWKTMSLRPDISVLETGPGDPHFT